MLRRRRREADRFATIDPTAVPARFARCVQDALTARRRWSELTGGLRDGPLRERVAELSADVDAGTWSVWETACRAGELDRVVAALDPEGATDDYKRAKRDPNADPSIVEALHARFTSVQRLLNAVDETADRLAVLDARLGAAIATAAELTLTGGQRAEDVATELGVVVGELDALRRSLDELGTGP